MSARLPRTLAEGWERFEGTVLPWTASLVQRTEMRRAFYAGAGLLFDAIQSSLSDDTDDITTEEVVALEALYDEIRQFSSALQRGDA